MTGGRDGAAAGAAELAGNTFAARLAKAVAAADSLACVGLDPHPKHTAPGEIDDFCRRIVDLTADYAAAFKPNSAFFEAAGPRGLDALAALHEFVPPGRLLILDAKRGDIASTAAAYAQAAFDVIGADAVTVNPYLGGDAVAPFLADPARGAFVLCRTTNLGADDFQSLEVAGESLYLAVARRAVSWNRADNVGLVVGATDPAALWEVRRLAPGLPFLVPGVGAQGGALHEAVAAGLDEAGGGLLVASSRSVVYADDPRAAARWLRDALAAARDAAMAGR